MSFVTRRLPSIDRFNLPISLGQIPLRSTLGRASSRPNALLINYVHAALGLGRLPRKPTLFHCKPVPRKFSFPVIQPFPSNRGTNALLCH